MTILLLLIPLSLLLVGIAAWAFVWAVRRGQFDDLDTPALDILGEDHRESVSARGHGGVDPTDAPGNNNDNNNNGDGDAD